MTLYIYGNERRVEKAHRVYSESSQEARPGAPGSEACGSR